MGATVILLERPMGATVILLERPMGATRHDL